jgi:hypothetical protein
VTFTITISNDGEHFHVALDGEDQSSHRTQADAEAAANRLLREMIPGAAKLAVPPIPPGGSFEQPLEGPTV